MADFKDNRYKNDKVFGGVMNFILLAGLLISSLAVSSTNWWYDVNPYISILTKPFSIEGKYFREKKVPLNQLSTVILRVVDYSWNHYSFEQVEQYINIEIVNVDYRFVDGKQTKKESIKGGIHTCTSKDFEKDDFE